jgi:hypothetical protein
LSAARRTVAAGAAKQKVGPSSRVASPLVIQLLVVRPALSLPPGCSILLYHHQGGCCERGFRTPHIPMLHA